MGLYSIKETLFLCEQYMTRNTNNISPFSSAAKRMCLWHMWSFAAQKYTLAWHKAFTKTVWNNLPKAIVVLLLIANKAILNSCLLKTYLFSTSEVGRLNSRNLCRGSSWLSHFQWRFLLEKLPAWTLLNKRGLGSKLSGQLKQKQLCSEYCCLVNASARILLLNKQRIIIGWQLELIYLKLQVNLHREGNIYLLSFSLLHFYQDYSWCHRPLSTDGECL